MPTREHQRLREITHTNQSWRKWGCYLSERSWGTVREDYSANGDAWSYFTFDMARSKAYRWGEDGIAGICDRYQLLCFSVALWNYNDPILKERLFGLTPNDGNHGEDVKEYYFYLDNLPTHSYMKYLYKYPQATFPYQKLVEENRRRGGQGYEYELLDTGVFDNDRYFDVFVEYAKVDQEDLSIRIEVFNRGPKKARVQLLPHLWFRNTWGWTGERDPEPVIKPGPRSAQYVSLVADDSPSKPLPNLPFQYRLGKTYLYAEGQPEALFTNNETNQMSLYGVPNETPYTKDGIDRHIINGEKTINPGKTGTKACFQYLLDIPAGKSKSVRLRLTQKKLAKPIDAVNTIVEEKKQEADDFYSHVHPPKASDDEKNIQRQAFAGLLWTKQIYLFDVDQWLKGDNPSMPPPESRYEIRNFRWKYLNSMRILSMPDKWEYPWFAAWDLAFHCIPFALIDIEFAKEQLWLFLFEQFQHPNGQIPAYEWEYSDLNPPVQAWAAWKIYNIEKERTGRADYGFLERCLHKLLINFAWWVNRVDESGNNIFEGGFLGLDNITVLDRSEELPEGAKLEQSDATGWMGMFCLNLMRMSLELSENNHEYTKLATKFFQHYVYIGAAMKSMGDFNYQLWNREDGFFYDVLGFPNGNFEVFRVRSLVGLIPIFPIDYIDHNHLKPYPVFESNLNWFLKNRQDIVEKCSYVEEKTGDIILAIVDREQLRRILQTIWDPNEFLSDFGIRSLSKHHLKHPFVFGGSRVDYEPAEAISKIKGGNSNWRGPIWFPTSYVLIDSLMKYDQAYHGKFTVDTFEGPKSPAEMAEGIANRMISIFTRTKDGRRPVFGGTEKFQQDPHWKDYILFYEYYHGDNGAGLGASHQTGWTGLVASLIDEWRR